jgi:membrane protein DedA with SNARE-associated domain
MLDSITDYIITLSPGWFYFALFISAYIENIFPPLPGDTVTVFGAYLVGKSQERVAEVFLSTTAGSLAGFMTYYALGRWIHPEFFIRRNFKFLPAEQFQKAGKWFERYGLWVVLLNRFFSGIRSVISLVSGLYRLPWLAVLVIAGIGCSFWNGMLIWAGYELGTNWRRVEGIFGKYNRVLLIVAVSLVAVWLVRRKLHKPRA